MRRTIAAAFLLLALETVLLAYPGKVLKVNYAPTGYCTGMTFDGTHFWVADFKADRIFKIEPEKWDVVGEIPSPGFWPRGLAWDGEFLWCVDAKQKMIFQVDRVDGTILNAIESPSGNPSGLTWDGETLWVSDYKAKKIMRIDLSDGTAVRTLTAPARSADGLCFDGKYLWCSDRLMDEIYMIEPETGEVVIITDSPGPYPRGLAWDGEFLWNVDYANSEIYKMVRRDDETYRLKNERISSVILTHEVKPYGHGMMKSLDVYLAVPEDMPQQKIHSTAFTEPSPEMKRDKWGQEVAAFHYENVTAGSTVQSIMDAQSSIHEIRYFIFPERVGSLDDIPAEIRERYTADGTKYRINDAYIKKLAEKTVGGETHPYYMARKIFDHVRKSLEYKLEGGWNTAPVVLKRGTGSCSEYTFCFIALCRAAGLPARYVGAIVVRGDDTSIDDVFHRWPEVYLPGYGWIPMDPQGGDKPLPRDRAMNIGNLSNRFLITTQGGGDSEYLGWYYNYNEAYASDPQVEVNIETFGDWRPILVDED